MKTFLRHAAKDALQSLVFRGRFVWRLPASGGAAVLTFDDGPHPQWTPAILDMLGQAGVRATFFLVGRAVQAHPQLVRRIVEEGHEVGGHSHDHTVITARSRPDLVADLARCRAEIAQAAGVDTRLFRPPKGEVSLRAIRTVCGAGYTLVHWSRTYSDYLQDGTAPLLDRLERVGARGGDILLFHDNNPYTAQALARTLPRWQDAGLRFTTLAAG